jgi:hypothetical protein
MPNVDRGPGGGRMGMGKFQRGSWRREEGQRSDREGRMWREGALGLSFLPLIAPNEGQRSDREERMRREGALGLSFLPLIAPNVVLAAQRRAA